MEAFPGMSFPDEPVAPVVRWFTDVEVERAAA